MTMNRRILLQVTAPAMLIGLLLLAACIGGAWSSTRLQRNLDRIRSESVVSLQAAQQLEIAARQLRFHCFRYLMDPTAANQDTIVEDEQNFHRWLRDARAAARTPDEVKYVSQIQDGFGKYQAELAQMREEVLRTKKPVDFRVLDRGHPIRHVVDSCRDLLRVSSQRMADTFQESEEVSRQARLAMVLLGVGGPLGGVLCGYGIARALSRSIAQLSVRVQDISQRLDQDLASVSVTADGDLGHLDQQLQEVVRRVAEVAERVQRQQRDMLRAEQLSAVGQLAASVAHEVRNPLTSVKLLVEAALRSNNRKPLSTDDLEVIHGEIHRLEQTVQGFLDFARLPSPQRRVLDLNCVVDQAVDLVRARARQQGVDIQCRRAGAPVMAEVDGNQLCTVLVNLLINALDAMPHGGRAYIDLEMLPGDKLQLAVLDTGPGVSQEIAGRLFVPFASTKPTGTGLGLSISKRIIEEHGGSLSAGCWPGGGAAFTIILPAAIASPKGQPPGQDVVDAGAGGTAPAGAVAAGERHADVVGR